MKNEEFLQKFIADTKEEISKLNYKKYFYQYSEQEKLVLAKEMKDIEVYFKQELELDIYPVYGTLLGIMRDQNFIGWDTDIDVAYLSKCKTKQAVLNEFNMICKFLEEKKLLMYRIKTASHLHIYSPSHHLRVDLWISWIDKNENYHLVWTIGGNFKSDIILPFKKIEFKNQTFHLINQDKKYLDYAYHNWNLPMSGDEKTWKKNPYIFELEQWHGK